MNVAMCFYATRLVCASMKRREVGRRPLSVFRTDMIIREDTNDWTPTKITPPPPNNNIVVAYVRAHADGPDRSLVFIFTCPLRGCTCLRVAVARSYLRLSAAA